MPVAFPSRDYDPEELMQLLRQFEATLVERTFPTYHAYLSAVEDFVQRHVAPDMEAFFRNMTHSAQLQIDPTDGSLCGAHEGLRNVHDQLSRVSGKIQDIFMPFLLEGSFLVLGDSQLLARVLEDVLAHNSNINILILEGLPHQSGVRLLHRLQNSSLVRGNPELLKRLLLAPDSSALRLLQRPKCNFVLLGAHAVTPHGCLITSAGSQQLAFLAQQCNVSVYSMCPTFKFAVSLKSMPFSSDDLVCLESSLARTDSGDAGLMSSANPGTSGAAAMALASGASSAAASSSATTTATATPASGANAAGGEINASFSGPPSFIQISPQLKPAVPSLSAATATASSSLMGDRFSSSPDGSTMVATNGATTGALSLQHLHRTPPLKPTPPPTVQTHDVIYAPTCASRLDLVGSNLVTHFFTEHGVIMPWSVANKVAKIFFKEAQNKRKVNRQPHHHAATAPAASSAAAPAAAAAAAAAATTTSPGRAPKLSAFSPVTGTMTSRLE